MAGRFSLFTWESIQQPLSVERDVNGNWWYELYNSNNKATLLSDKQKIKVVLTNPAVLKVFKLNCDMFSLGKINQYNGNDLAEVDYLYSLKKKPNLRQTWTQFLWDYMFWKMTGTAYLWRSSNVLNESTQLYWLNPANIDWENGKGKFSKFLFSKLGLNKEQAETIKYTFDDGSTSRIPLSQITPFFDLSNGIGGNWYVGNSTLDALYKVIHNSELSLDAKAINLEFSAKFMVNGKNSIDDISNLPMGETEKLDIENNLRGKKKVHAVKTPIDIKRFVDDIARLKLDESFYNDYFMIGSIYGIPRDVLEANLRGSTYENQEKATGRHVEYCLKPSGQVLTDELEALFGFESLKMEWNHLLFNQVFEKDKADRQGIQLDNIQKALNMGALSEQEAKQKIDLILNS